MWRLTLVRTTIGTFGEETNELDFNFKNFGGLMAFAGDALEYSNRTVKAIIEQVEKGKVNEAV